VDYIHHDAYSVTALLHTCSTDRSVADCSEIGYGTVLFAVLFVTLQIIISDGELASILYGVGTGKKTNMLALIIDVTQQTIARISVT
jgi:hypothetical protein